MSWHRIFRATTTRPGCPSTPMPWCRRSAIGPTWSWWPSRSVASRPRSSVTNVAVRLLVLVAPMIPAPGEAPADYWVNTRYNEEVRESYDDPIELFYQDVPPELASEALKRGREQSEARMGEASPLKAWPDVPTRVLLCREDRLFPAAFLRRVARERLGTTPDEIEGGHTPALSHPKELAERLQAYAAQEGVSSG